MLYVFLENTCKAIVYLVYIEGGLQSEVNNVCKTKYLFTTQGNPSSFTDVPLCSSENTFVHYFGHLVHRRLELTFNHLF